ncbi:hypothetical protein ACM46_17750 [Chryseobacterium angstadtii]|uniref:Lipoprotein n=1 Tax=Chryseobacterium angstadtii TaxID=558151 RepID=A0A0J7I105_9FLAO|nr:hypothetical protein [Chryseobacterium angstadtii]KMQ60088.1 hypothetical protein ACM46_17750 [Chryseobacterium angstadtii]
MKAIVLILLTITIQSCNGQENKKTEHTNKTKTQEKKILKTSSDNTSSINFFDDKYKNNGYYIPDNLNGEIYPMYSYMDEDIGAFSVNYIGKTQEEQDFWSVYNHNGFFKDKKIENISSNLIQGSLKSRVKNYYIIADYLEKKIHSEF